ncbi:complex I assembly factor ACAD9, mitochondrial [Lutzomyia longipalpis]|uniref:complex I assembly factor ACAD9, mitochondrial n=1 Tax=Lutzomyia longipalpis TaxID=7200 RepID=UPI0024838B5B|nr:complex I assembly factor ACAD9, mitochondrial [Lutzomyia longipalpis]
MFIAGRSAIRRFLTQSQPTWVAISTANPLRGAQTQPQASSSAKTPAEDGAKKKEVVQEESTKTPGIRIIDTKVEKRLPRKEPLVKNMFMCRVDTDLLVYPEAFDYQAHPEMMDKTTPIREDFNGFTDMSQIDHEGKIPETVWRKIEQHGLFGLNIPQHFGGRGFLVTDSLYTLESLAGEPALLAALGAHHQVAEVIMKLGTEEQKQIYLPRLASGDLIGSIALQEHHDAETGLFNTTATCNADETVWKISGEKAFVLNGTKANLFVVFAKTEAINYKGANDEVVTAFIIEADRNGIDKVPETSHGFGFRGTESISVKFTNVEVPSRNILGKIGEGPKIGEEMLKLHRLHGGLIAVGILRKFLEENAKHCINRKQIGVSLTEMDMLKNRFSRIICDTYAVESTMYLTAGLMDMYDGQDVTLECGIVKNLAAMALSRGICSATNHRDPSVFTPGHVTERFLRDALQFQTHGEVLDSLRGLIALTGLQFVGKELYENVKKIRNPLFHPSFVMKRLFTSQSFDRPKKFANLEHYLHLSVKSGADALELSITRLHLMTEFLLNRHGTEILKHQLELIRLAEAASHCFAMFASVARASRSYCIGLRHADYEMHVATNICSHGTEGIVELAKETQMHEMFSHDVAHQIVGKQFFKSRGYFLEHPITRNF